MSLEQIIAELLRKTGTDHQSNSLLEHLRSEITHLQSQLEQQHGYVEAIFDVSDVPAPCQPLIALNAERVIALKANGNITQKQTPLVGVGCKGSLAR